MQSLLIVFAHLASSQQLEGLLTFLSQVPDPSGRPALEYVITEWCARHVCMMVLLLLNILFLYVFLALCSLVSLVAMSRGSAPLLYVSCSLTALILETRDSTVLLW